MKEYTLVVIDMQPAFPASGDVTIMAAVKRELGKAVQRGFPIVVVEFSGDGTHVPTNASLMQEVLGYNRLQVVRKYKSDGSAQVLSTCSEHGFGSERFRVCGVYTPLCVLSTVLGIKRAAPNTSITVVQDACKNEPGLTDGWVRFERIPNVHLLRRSENQAA